ncbi:MAG TPA: HEPN domain-containing protein [Terriglobia bacterium]|nr:HEPN domain-containing protein [Terriglobia bacterium]
MTDRPKRARQAGTFSISPDRTVYGELTYAGPSTSLVLRDGDYFDTYPIGGGCLRGTLHDLTKVALLHCVTSRVPASATKGTEQYYLAEVFPHFIVHGEHQITNEEKEITDVQFLVDDATRIFWDCNAFGTLIDARPLIKDVVSAKRRELDKWPGPTREIQIGPEPAILYFSGKHEILSSDTVLGRVRASHHTSHRLGSPRGVCIKSRIFTGITFADPCSFDDVINRTLTLLRFLELVAGRPQNLLSLQILVKSEDETPCILDVYWSRPPKRKVGYSLRPDPIDVLINGGMQPGEFARVLSNWLSRDQTWRDARVRFSNCFAEQGYYTTDRLIGSANMFDILPASAVPPDVILSEELKSAKERCATIWRELPQSPERASVLNALGRVGKSMLKHKIRHRGKLLNDAAGNQFPDIDTVTDEAVNCRNYYVHGGESRFDYENHPELRSFFTDTLEFVFAASDLVEAGWDMKAWCATPTVMSHPFNRYRIGYKENLCKLRSVLELERAR